MKKIDKWTVCMKIIKMIIPKNKSKVKDKEQIIGNKKEIKKGQKIILRKEEMPQKKRILRFHLCILLFVS